MKNLKNVLLTGTITLATLLTMTVTSKAATVKVTGEVVNIRKEASTSSKVVAMLSENVECEYLGEEGNWYKVKYKKYTGYVSKDYTKLIGEVSNNQENSGTNQNTQTNNETSKPNNNSNSENAQGNNSQINNQSNSQNVNSNSNTENSQKNDGTKLTYKKFNQKADIRILPLIYSSSIGEAKKDDEVLILSETSGWSYIQTDEISGWVRTNTLGDAKTVTSGDTNQTDKPATTERTGYISEEYVNMRKGAGTTYAVVKVLKLNNQVTIVEESGKWYKVKSGNDTGYVSKDYVSDSKTVTDRGLSEPRKDKNEDTKNDVTNSKDNTSTNKPTTTSGNDKNSVITDNKDKNSNTNTNNSTTTTNKTNTNNKDNTDKTNKSDKNNTDKTSTSNKNDADKTSTATTSKSKIKGTDVIAYAKKYLGHKYVWAGAKPGGFDCSGFTMYVYKHFGVSLPHYTVSQYNSSKGKKITKQSDLKMGDIVFLTDYETGAPCGHCGIYISNGQFIHADSSVGHVNISNLNGIYKGRFCGALRVNGVGN